MYRLYDEFGDFMRVVKRKEEAEHFVKYYGWTMKFFKNPKKQKTKEALKNYLLTTNQNSKKSLMTFYSQKYWLEK